MDDLEFQALLIQNLRSNSLLTAIRASFENFDEFYDKYAEEQQKKWTQFFILTISFIVSIVSVWISVLDFSVEWKIFLIVFVLLCASLVALYYLAKYEWFSRKDREFRDYFRCFDRNLSRLNEHKFSITSTDHLIQAIEGKKDHFDVTHEFTLTREYYLNSIEDLFNEVDKVKDYLENLCQDNEEYKHDFSEYYHIFYQNLKEWWNKYKKAHEADFQDNKSQRTTEN